MIYIDNIRIHNMYNSKIQTPISSDVLEQARNRARNMGFSSINDVIRIIVQQFGEGKLNFQLVRTNSQPRQIDYVDDQEQKELEKILLDDRKKGMDEIVKTKVVDL
jgi:antitoxin component of RelBE/YafQ-DinJ toxin-antitoxin module